MGGVKHGTFGAYNYWKCRCDTCCAFRKKWNRKYRVKNRAALRIRRRQQYKDNPERYKSSEQGRRARRRALLARYKVMRGCERCGYNKHPRALHFHHIRPEEKLFQISLGIGKPMEILKAEIAKCELLCANCHMIAEDEKKCRT